MHPEIPHELSNKAKSFILRCFEAKPEERATAAELLEDPFLCEYVHVILLIIEPSKTSLFSGYVLQEKSIKNTYNYFIQ